ncbi:hypothetical protein LPB137_07775 [Poseidonibacter parvus]|uniref:Pyrroline-5-carboxylate reductase catalytic N-terminal domain-containing protein n=1 Tax=Poseidonibacter parvus TaxID=1850254 RepID=A0A1P8KMN1_9BACT|nr:hypothetical protein [Poseidonibacter parvus]APW65759.1 hypothetical protein LPB137_07775 [Poseidonibacter parvus]
MSKKKKIAILGCGWVGNALKTKMEEQGHEVNCLCRDINMDSLVGFYNCDALIIAVPPSDEYLDVIEDVYFSVSLNEAINTQMILLSSLSFYDNDKLIADAEELAKIKDENTVILRLGELMGYDRIAGENTAGKMTNDSTTNYVHRDDVIGVIEIIIDKNVRNKIFNVVAPIQSTKKEIFTQNSKKFNFKEPSFSNIIDKNNSYSSDILCDVLGYKFQKENVQDFWS